MNYVSRCEPVYSRKSDILPNNYVYVYKIRLASLFVPRFVITQVMNLLI